MYYLNKLPAWFSLIFILLLLIQSCKVNDSKEVKEKNNIISFELKISETHRSFFTDELKKIYIGDEIKLFFQSMESKSNPVCEMSWGKKKLDRNLLYSYLKKEIFLKPPFDEFLKPNQLLSKLISGCWNFFLMNDENPEKDFEKVKAYYPQDKKKCYSVAFMQPYLMHSILDCETLTFIDTDWKVLYAHSQLMEKFQANRFTNEEEAKKAISEIKLSWIGNIIPPNPELKDVDIDTFCKGQTKVCLNALLDFQRKFKNLKSIDYRLTYLHDLEFTKEKGTVSIFYMSNAIDPQYTDSNQFKLFLGNIKNFLEVNEKLVLMYHSGARPLYGIYELTNVGDKLTVTAKCKDRYLDPPVVQNQNYYSTKLEYYLTDKKFPPYCSPKQVDKPISDN